MNTEILEEEKKYHKGKEDIVFKIVFLDEKDKSMLEELLSRLLEKKVKVIKFLRNEIGKEYYNEKDSYNKN